MKPSEILRAAAAHLERRGCMSTEGVCWAIVDVAGVEGDDALLTLLSDPRAAPAYGFLRCVEPQPKDYGDGVRPAYWWGLFCPDSHNARIVGACLAAAIAESEGQ